MNRPLRNMDFEPYRPIRDRAHLRSRFVVRTKRGGYVSADAPDNDIGAVFDPKENLQKIRSSILEPSAVSADSVRLAELALLRQVGASDPARIAISVESLALDLSKILD